MELHHHFHYLGIRIAIMKKGTKITHMELHHHFHYKVLEILMMRRVEVDKTEILVLLTLMRILLILRITISLWEVEK